MRARVEALLDGAERPRGVVVAAAVLPLGGERHDDAELEPWTDVNGAGRPGNPAKKEVRRVRFELTPPERLRLECSALDHSASDAEDKKLNAIYPDRTGDLQIFSLALSQLS